MQVTSRKVEEQLLAELMHFIERNNEDLKIKQFKYILNAALKIHYSVTKKKYLRSSEVEKPLLIGEKQQIELGEKFGHSIKTKSPTFDGKQFASN